MRAAGGAAAPFPEFECRRCCRAEPFATNNTKTAAVGQLPQAMRAHRFRARLVPAPARNATADPLHRKTKGAHYQADQKPKFEMWNSAGGLSSARGAANDEEAGHYYWRMHPVDQCLVHHRDATTAQNRLNAPPGVPIDDGPSFTWTFTDNPTRPLSRHGDRRNEQAASIHVPLIAGKFQAHHQQGQIHDGPLRRKKPPARLSAA